MTQTLSPNGLCFSSEKRHSSQVYANDDTRLKKSVPPFAFSGQLSSIKAIPRTQRNDQYHERRIILEGGPSTQRKQERSVVCVVRKPSFVGNRKRMSIPDRSSRTPPRLQPFPETSSRSNPQPSISLAPLTHRILRVDVRPRLQQQFHHIKMTLVRNYVQRRDSTLRRVPPRQHLVSESHPGPCVRPLVFAPPWS